MDKEDVVDIYNGILLSHKKNEIMLSAATWMDLEIMILSEARERKANTVWYHLYVESNYYTNELIYKTETLIDMEVRLNSCRGKEGVCVWGQRGTLGLADTS